MIRSKDIKNFEQRSLLSLNESSSLDNSGMILTEVPIGSFASPMFHKLSSSGRLFKDDYIIFQEKSIEI